MDHSRRCEGARRPVGFDPTTAADVPVEWVGGRARCVACGRMIYVNQDGTLRYHLRPRQQPEQHGKDKSMVWIRMSDGTELAAPTAESVVGLMKDGGFDGASTSLDDYMRAVAERVQGLHDIPLVYEDALTFLRELWRIGELVELEYKTPKAEKGPF